MKPRIKLMPDYCAYPLWGIDPDNIGNINPYDLPLTPETIKSLESYAAEYNAGLNWDDPGNTPDPTLAEINAFEAAGITLWERLDQELSKDYEVFYFSQKLGKLVKNPREIMIIVK